MAATVNALLLLDPLGAFQSPIHRVNGCNDVAIGDVLPAIAVSVPYSSGQWLQPRACGAGSSSTAVSVPYSSGQWLQQLCQLFIDSQPEEFQSPIHRVNGCNAWKRGWLPERCKVSVPYSSGQWLQHQPANIDDLLNECFSPLFIGSMAATS